MAQHTQSTEVPDELLAALEPFFSPQTALAWCCSHNTAWGARPVDVYARLGLDEVISVAGSQAWGDYS